jgi:asparagine synthetase B (glutamine-hydrolysing)
VSQALDDRVEFISPSYDLEMIRFALALPLECKFQNGMTKVLLRRIASRVLGREIPKRASPNPARLWRLGPDFAERLTGSWPVFLLSKPDGSAWKLRPAWPNSKPIQNVPSGAPRSSNYVASGSMDMNQETIYSDISRSAAGAASFYSAAKGTSHEYRLLAPKGEHVRERPRQRRATAGILDPDLHRMRDELASRFRTSGILLSGGTDSTLLAALLRDPFSAAGRLRCFTQDFRWRRYSELAQARANAGVLGIETEPVMLDRRKHYAAVLALNSRLQDQPCVTMQAFNLWSFIHSVSGRCRAFMLGEHADSLFLGFGHFFQGLPSDLNAHLRATDAIPPDQRLQWGRSSPRRQRLGSRASLRPRSARKRVPRLVGELLENPGGSARAIPRPASDLLTTTERADRWWTELAANHASGHQVRGWRSHFDAVL